MTLEGETTRPTSERVKESLFSMIQFDLADTWVLDLFGGSGQLGLEAVSRGAEKAHIIDRSPEAVDIIRRNAKKTHLDGRCRIFNMDSLEYLKTSKGLYKFDFVFLDPPYDSGLLKQALALLPDSGLLADGAWIFAEDGKGDVFGGDAELASRYNVEKSSRYGHIHVTVLSVK